LVTTTALIPPAVITTTLVVRDAGTVLRYSVRLEPLSAPIAMWRILYQGEPEQQDLRQEQRNDADTFNGWTHHPDHELEEWLPTTSYDFSLRAIRFFAPWRLSPDTVVPVRWQLDNDRIEGTLRVVRQDKAAVWWQKQQGYQTVGQWESLTDPMRYRWRVYCWRHQPTSSRPLGG
jgi:hypothetical protein